MCLWASCRCRSNRYVPCLRTHSGGRLGGLRASGWRCPQHRSSQDDARRRFPPLLHGLATPVPALPNAPPSIDRPICHDRRASRQHAALWLWHGAAVVVHRSETTSSSATQNTHTRARPSAEHTRQDPPSQPPSQPPSHTTTTTYRKEPWRRRQSGPGPGHRACCWRGRPGRAGGTSRSTP